MCRDVFVFNCVKVEAYSVEQEGCPLICRFATMGSVKSIKHSKIGTNSPSHPSVVLASTH